MRTLVRFGLAAAVGYSLGGAALAQQMGGTDTGGVGGGTGAGQNLAQMIQFQTPSSLDQSLGSQIGASSLNQSNILGKYYVNPYYQGRAGAVTGETPGGFGQVLYNTTGGATGGRTSTGFGGTTGGRTTTGFGGTTGGRTTTTGFGGTTGGRTTTGFGGATGFGGTTGFGTTTGFGGGGRAGGIGGLGTTGLGGGRTGGLGGMTGLGGMGMTNTAQVVPLTRQINYTATLRVPQSAPAAVATRMQAEVQAVIAQSSAISNPAGVQVATEGPVVFLRGAARDEDEARLIENMIRLTPGVREVRNELRFPAQQPQP